MIFCICLGVNETVSNVRVSFHNVTWKTQEHATVTGLFRHDPYINLLCSFTPSADDTLLYHIDWYVDNDIVIQGQTVDKNSLQDAILSAEDLIYANKKINSWVIKLAFFSVFDVATLIKLHFCRKIKISLK